MKTRKIATLNWNLDLVAQPWAVHEQSNEQYPEAQAIILKIQQDIKEGRNVSKPHNP